MAVPAIMCRSAQNDVCVVIFNLARQPRSTRPGQTYLTLKPNTYKKELIWVVPRAKR